MHKASYNMCPIVSCTKGQVVYRMTNPLGHLNSQARRFETNWRLFPIFAWKLKKLELYDSCIANGISSANKNTVLNFSLYTQCFLLLYFFSEQAFMLIFVNWVGRSECKSHTQAGFKPPGRRQFLKFRSFQVQWGMVLYVHLASLFSKKYNVTNYISTKIIWNSHISHHIHRKDVCIYI